MKQIFNCIEAYPFPGQGIAIRLREQFHVEFKHVCQEKNTRMFMLFPLFPKLNEYIERAHRMHVEEFCQVPADDLDIPTLNNALREWERIYNDAEQHHSLGNLTPKVYISNYSQ